MPTLKILLLGPPAVYYDDKPLPIQRRMLRVLLYYLAHQQNMVDRSQIIVSLWPDENESTGRRRLRELLSKLRAELPDPELLVTEQDQIGLDRSRLYVDSLHFDQLFKENSPIVNTIPRNLPLPERTHHEIREAIGLWRTPFFMAGVKVPDSEVLDHWVSDSARSLERRRILLIDRLSDHFAALGDIESALSWLSQIIEDDPYNEDYQVRYLTWLNQLNRRSEAAIYNDYLNDYYLARGESLPERIKKASILSNQNSLEQKLIENPFWPPPAQLQIPFTGRNQEIRQINTAFQHGGILFLWGEQGSGKTRLIYEFSKQIAFKSRLLMASGFSSTKDQPYYFIVEMLRRSISDEEWKNMTPTWITPLVPLMPELGRYVPLVSRFRDTQLTDVQGVVFESFHQIFNKLAKQSQLLVFIDDAHFCDRSSLDFLEYLFHHGFFEYHGLLVISARPEEKNGFLKTFLDQVQNPPYRFEEIHISDFTLDDASSLMTLMLGRSYPNQAVQQLLDIADKKPLYFVELVRSVLEYSAWVDLEEMIDRLPLPKSILEMAKRRIEMLSMNARRVLQMASVIGGNFRPVLFELALELTPEEVADALDELEFQRLIKSGGSGPTGTSYHFLYNHIQNIVLDDISQARKRLLHLYIAKSMKALPQESCNPSLIANHFESAGELKQAFDYWVDAGIRAMELYSRTDAEYAFTKAASLIQYLGNFVTEEEIYRLYATWGDLLDLADDHKSGVDLFFNLRALGNQRHSHILLGTAFNGLTRSYRNMGEYKRSLQYSFQAEEYLKTSQIMPEYFSVFTRRAVIYAFLEDFDKLEKTIKIAIELASRIQSERVQIGLSSAFYQIVDIIYYQGWLHKALEICELGLHSVESTINNPDLEIIRLKMGLVNALFGYPQKTYGIADQVLKLATEWNHNRLIGFAKQIRAEAAMGMGWLGECLDGLEDALQIAVQYNYKDLAQRTYTLIGDFYRILEQYNLAEQAYLSSQESNSRPYYSVNNQIRYGFVLTRMNRAQEGWDVINNALQNAESGGYRVIQKLGYNFLATSFLFGGDTAQAEIAIDAFDNTIKDAEVPRWKIMSKLFSLFLNFKKGNRIEPNEVEEIISVGRENGDIWFELSACRLLMEIQEKQTGGQSIVCNRVKEIQDYVMEHAWREDVREMVHNLFKKS